MAKVISIIVHELLQGLLWNEFSVNFKQFKWKGLYKVPHNFIDCTLWIICEIPGLLWIEDLSYFNPSYEAWVRPRIPLPPSLDGVVVDHQVPRDRRRVPHYTKVCGTLPIPRTRLLAGWYYDNDYMDGTAPFGGRRTLKTKWEMCKCANVQMWNVKVFSAHLFARSLDPESI